MLLSRSHITAELSARPQRTEMATVSSELLLLLTWSVPCSALLIFISLSDYYIGRKLGQTENPIHRKRLLISGLVVNLGLLGFFKDSNFLLENIWLALSALGMHFNRPHYDIILPPGISYFTFASLSYILDVYYERI